MRKEFLIRAANHLAQIADGSITPPGDQGLCISVARNCDGNGWYLVSTYANEWPKFSGWKDYPVPATLTDDPGRDFDNAADNGNLYNGEYGRLRRELAGFVADCVVNDLLDGKLRFSQVGYAGRKTSKTVSYLGQTIDVPKWATEITIEGDRLIARTVLPQNLEIIEYVGGVIWFGNVNLLDVLDKLYLRRAYE